MPCDMRGAGCGEIFGNLRKDCPWVGNSCILDVKKMNDTSSTSCSCLITAIVHEGKYAKFINVDDDVWVDPERRYPEALSKWARRGSCECP